ncbi:uncharacterized protein LOC124127165 [Haliotis rufescens]|uniref:uncharacterized protein LOC124127165 n=1 Tax=Haliotis rufescens TaxID=6454 RepID=UPI00201F85E8|nr:uncharacterized protein LOC124127165 [Haliotis rufescens]
MAMVAIVLALTVLSTQSVRAMRAVSQRNETQDQVKTEISFSHSAASFPDADAAHVYEHHSSDIQSAMKSTRWPENTEGGRQDSNLMMEETQVRDGGRQKRAAIFAAAIPVIGEFFRSIFQGSSNTPDCMTEAQLERKFQEYQLLMLASGAKEITGVSAVVLFIGTSALHVVLALQMGF